jgi:putative hemolysin
VSYLRICLQRMNWCNSLPVLPYSLAMELVTIHFNLDPIHVVIHLIS